MKTLEDVRPKLATLEESIRTLEAKMQALLEKVSPLSLSSHLSISRPLLLSPLFPLPSPQLIVIVQKSTVKSKRVVIEKELAAQDPNYVSLRDIEIQDVSGTYSPLLLSPFLSLSPPIYPLIISSIIASS